MRDEHEARSAMAGWSVLRQQRRLALGAVSILIGGAAFWVAPYGSSVFLSGLASGILATRLFWSNQTTISKRQRVKARRHRREELNDILNAINDPLLLIDASKMVRVANEAARRAFPALVLNEPLSFGLRIPDVISGVDSCLARHQAVTTQIRERVPVGRSFSVNIAPLTLNNEVTPARDEPVALLMLRETSHERRVETMRTDFVANASHELRTPLASILGFIETLQGPARNDVIAREKFLAIMADQARRMARLVDDLLSLSRIEMKSHIRPDAPVDVKAIIEQLLQSHGGLAATRSVTLNLECCTQTPVVCGDRDELSQVFANLIENAIKYGRSGGKVDIMIEALPVSEEIAISVTDYGAGIEPQHLPRLTERFYRVDTTFSRAEGGTGLGLAIVKHIISRHRGRLAITSEPEKGATFKVTLAKHGA